MSCFCQFCSLLSNMEHDLEFLAQENQDLLRKWVQAFMGDDFTRGRASTFSFEEAGREECGPGIVFEATELFFHAQDMVLSSRTAILFVGAYMTAVCSVERRNNPSQDTDASNNTLMSRFEGARARANHAVEAIIAEENRPTWKRLRFMMQFALVFHPKRTDGVSSETATLTNSRGEDIGSVEVNASGMWPRSRPDGATIDDIAMTGENDRCRIPSSDPKMITFIAQHFESFTVTFRSLAGDETRDERIEHAHRI